MRVKSVLWIALLPSVLPASAQRKLRPRYPLPARAKVVVDGGYNDIPKDASEHRACDDFHTTPRQMRRLFRVAAQISGMERHDGIYEVACGIDGHILLDGKTFTWRLVNSDEGFMETDFPDGRDKYLAHTVSDLSDDPKEHRLSKYVDTRYWNK